MTAKEKLKTLIIGIGTAILTSCGGGKGKLPQQTDTDNTVNKEVQIKEHKSTLASDNKTAPFANIQKQDSANVKTTAATTKKLRDKLKQDSLNNAIQANIQQVGVDIRYNAKDSIYSYEYSDGSGFLDIKDMDFAKISESYMEMQKERFAEPTKYVDVDADICERIEDPSCTLAYYAPETNTITVKHFFIGNKAKAIKKIMEKTDCNIQEADSLLSVLCKELNNKEFVESRVKHEESHRDDFQANYFMPNLSRNRMAQIQFFSEIKATMQQAALALEKFHNDGDMTHFAPITNYLNNQVKDIISRTKDKEQHKKIIGKAVFHSWLKNWNKENSPYNDDVSSIVYGASSGAAFFYQDNVKETAEAYNEYKQRVDSMFANVGYLGNMQKVVNVDFQLNDEIKDYLNISNSEVFMNITQNSQTNAEAYQRLAELFAIVRDCDSDGTRTQKEQDLINKTIQTLTEKAQSKQDTVNSQPTGNELLSQVINNNKVNN